MGRGGGIAFSRLCRSSGRSEGREGGDLRERGANGGRRGTAAQKPGRAGESSQRKGGIQRQRLGAMQGKEGDAEREEEVGEGGSQ